MIYHIAISDEWRAGQEEGMYTPAAFDADGFIHLSSLDQIVDVANRYFRGQRSLVLVCVDPAAVEAPIKYEDLASQGQCYPHIHGKPIWTRSSKSSHLILTQMAHTADSWDSNSGNSRGTAPPSERDRRR